MKGIPSLNDQVLSASSNRTCLGQPLATQWRRQSLCAKVVGERNIFFTWWFYGGYSIYIYMCVCVLNCWIEYTVYTHLNICSDSPGSHSRLDPSTTMHHPPSSSSSSSSSPHDSMPRTLPVLERLPLLRACSKTCRYFELKDFSSSETFSDPTQAGHSKLSGRYPLVRPLMGPWASVGWHIMLLVATCS